MIVYGAIAIASIVYLLVTIKSIAFALRKEHVFRDTASVLFGLFWPITLALTAIAWLFTNKKMVDKFRK